MSMVSTDIANTVDRTLREIMQKDVPFGGKPIVFLGDFKQLLPVTPGSKTDNTVKSCDWWQSAKVFKFSHNFRAHLNPEYAGFLDDVGNGRITDVPVPVSSLTDNMETLVHRVYGEDMADVPRTKNLILALTLEACNQVNNYCLERLAGASNCSHANGATARHTQQQQLSRTRTSRNLANSRSITSWIKINTKRTL